MWYCFCLLIFLLLQLSTISFFIRPLKGNRRSTNSLALSSGKVKIPEHIAYICDGNGRWGIENNLTRADGHRVGANRTVEIVKSSFELGSRVVTLYLFSTENWSRPIDEIMYIFNLLESHLMSFSQYLYDNKVRIKVIGQVEKLPLTLQNLIKTFNKEAINDNGSEKTLILAISYGGKNDIVESTKRIASLILENKISIADINESLVHKYLSTSTIPDPDIIVRSAGEMRLSNFYLYQSAYSTLYPVDCYWPEFNSEMLKKIYEKYRIDNNKKLGGL